MKGKLFSLPFELYIDFANNIFKSVRFFVHISPSNNQRCEVKISAFLYFPTLAIAACAAASLAIGTRNGEQDT